MSTATVRAIVIALLFITTTAGTSTAEFLTVDAAANIFGAGHSSAPDPGGGGGGELPPGFSFSSGSAQILTFSSVIGIVSLAAGESNDGDGFFAASTNISSFGGISGISYAGRHAFLVGVFLNNAEPTDPAPPVLSYSGGDSITAFSPLLDQTFFIGLGHTDGGVTQQFYVPAGATRLYLGFADARGWSGDTGYYGDNTGSLSVNFAISGAVPEPSSLILLVSGTFGLSMGVLRRRRLAASN